MFAMLDFVMAVRFVGDDAAYSSGTSADNGSAWTTHFGPDHGTPYRATADKFCLRVMAVVMRVGLRRGIFV